MDIRRRIRTGRGFTPTEQQLGNTVLALGERLQGLSIKELARLSTTSIASIHRFCKKLGLEGYKELKVALARDAARDNPAEVDINFPFAAGERATAIMPQLRAVYESTLRDTAELIEPSALDRAAEVLDDAACIDIYTQSHNLYPAQMFCDRLLSAGRNATCHESPERLVRTALATGANHAAVAISYSGLNQQLATLLPILAERGCPVVFIGTAAAQRLHPGLTAYLTVSDREHLQDRITQFASHIAVQDACSLATTSAASRFWNGRSPTRGCRDRTTRSPARRTPGPQAPKRGRAVRGPQSGHNFKSVTVEIRGTR